MNRFEGHRIRPTMANRARDSETTFTIRQIHPEVPSVILDIPDSDSSDSSDYEINEIRRPVGENCSFIEAFLNFEYTFGFSPFKVDTTGAIITSGFHKIWTITTLIFAMTSLFISINTIKSSINRKREVNNIANYVEWLHYFSVAVLHFVYWKTLWTGGNRITAYLSKCKGTNFASTIYRPWVKYFVIGLRVTSLIVCISTVTSGIDIVHTSVLRASGWSFYDVLLAREYKIVYAFPRVFQSKVTSTNQTSHTTLENAGNPWIDKKVLVGFCGGIFTLIEFCISSSIRDLMLITTISLYAITKAGKLTNKDDDAETVLSAREATYQAILKRYEDLVSLAKEMTRVVKELLPYAVAVDVLTVNGLLHNGIEGNWSYCASVGFNLLKGFTTFYIAIRINGEVEAFQEWFVSRQTQEVLRIPPSQLHSIIYEFSLKPIGVGTNAFQVDGGFIANFIGITSTYFFIVAEAKAQ